LGRLSSLHALGVVNVSTNAGPQAMRAFWIENLSHLHELGVANINRNNT
jgi:hypothetical protein